MKRKYLLGLFVLILIAFMLAACGSSGGKEDPTQVSDISGTITLPSNVTDKCCVVLLDLDNIPDNDIIRYTVNQMSGSTITYKFNNVPNGMYYVYAAVDVDQSGGTDCSTFAANGDFFTAGDYLGYYGGTGLNPPGAANVPVTHDDGLTYNFSLAKYTSSDDCYKFVREIQNGGIIFEHKSCDVSQSNYLFIANPETVSSISAEVTVTEYSNSGAKPPEVRLRGVFYNDGSSGASSGSSIGDIFAGVRLRDGEVINNVFRCTDDGCIDVDVLDSGVIGAYILGEKHEIGIEWDETNTKFIFSFDGSLTEVDTSTLNAPVISSTPNLPYIGIGSRIRASSGEYGSVTSRFDNVYVNGSLYDDFSQSSIDFSKWTDTIVNIPKDCGEGLPLTISNLQFPDTVSAGNSYSGSVTYSGSYEDIANPVMGLRIETNIAIRTTFIMAPPTVSDCTFSFMGSIPDEISGSVDTKFKLVDHEGSADNWNDNAASNELIKKVTVYDPIDSDGDGYTENDDCNDLNSNIYPGATEVCDGIDQDCDGQIDDNLSRVTTCGVGECAGNTGTETCTNGNWGNDTCNPTAGSSTEICDVKDNDCDGVADEGCDCTNGSTRSCGSNTGECAAGTETCVNGQWDGCSGEVGPATEICDGKDNDCDGMTDEGDACDDTPNPITPGEWTAIAESNLWFTFIVNSESTLITKISYNFSSWKCGGIIASGKITTSSSQGWPITDGQFTIENDLGQGTDTRPWTISGMFDETGTQASGTWKAIVKGTTCSGNWEASPST